MTEQSSKPRLCPVIRVFVSSTFSDLKPERNALQAQVFPKLEQLCAQNGFQFQAIDLRFRLRHGYAGQGGHQQQSRPGSEHYADLPGRNYPWPGGDTPHRGKEEGRRRQKSDSVVLLGDRHGWRPLPTQLWTRSPPKSVGAACLSVDRGLRAPACFRCLVDNGSRAAGNSSRLFEPMARSGFLDSFGL